MISITKTEFSRSGDGLSVHAQSRVLYQVVIIDMDRGVLRNIELR